MYYETEYYVFIISIMRLLVWKNINFIDVLCKRMRNFAPEKQSSQLWKELFYKLFIH